MKRFILLFLCMLLAAAAVWAEGTDSGTSSGVLPPPQSGTLLSGSTTDNRQSQPDTSMDNVPLYESTLQYMDILNENKLSCVYRGKQSSTTESVISTFYGTNTTLNTLAIFSDTETDCVIYVLHFVDFEDKNPDLVSPLLDALNAEYRFAKFYSAPNGSVSVTLDLLFPTGAAGEICYDGLRRLLNICDECYPALAASISDLPAAGEVISAPAAVAQTNTAAVQEPETVETPEVPVPEATAAPTTANGRDIIMKVKIRNGGVVNVRKSPDQNSILIGTVEGGSVLDCVGKEDNGWYEIVLSNGMTGFISGKRVTELN